MGNIIDMETRSNVKLLCELGDSAACGLAVYCRAEQTQIPTKAKRNDGRVVDNPSVARLCAGEPRLCPSRQAFLATGRTQQDEAARAKRAQEIEKDRDDEILEEFVRPLRARR